MSEKPKGKVSVFAVIEMIILAFGVAMSLSSTIKVLRVTDKYIWCFVFAAVGFLLIVILAVNIRKKYTWLAGIIFIVFYLFFAGYGAFVCELNASRIKKVEYYSEQGVTAEVGDVSYEWDRESVTYNPDGLEYLDESVEPYQKIRIGEEERKLCIYTGSDPNVIYIEVYSGGTGIFLILSRV